VYVCFIALLLSCDFLPCAALALAEINQVATVAAAADGSHSGSDEDEDEDGGTEILGSGASRGGLAGHSTSLLNSRRAQAADPTRRNNHMYSSYVPDGSRQLGSESGSPFKKQKLNAATHTLTDGSYQLEASVESDDAQAGTCAALIPSSLYPGLLHTPRSPSPLTMRGQLLPVEPDVEHSHLDLSTRSMHTTVHEFSPLQQQQQQQQHGDLSPSRLGGSRDTAARHQVRHNALAPPSVQRALWPRA